MFNHENFEPYELSLDYWKLTLKFLERLPAGNSVLKDQLRRAASSITLNIAEGSGRAKPRDRKRFYAIARGSALECAAIGDLIVVIQPDLEPSVNEAKCKLKSVVNILSSIILR